MGKRRSAAASFNTRKLARAYERVAWASEGVLPLPSTPASLPVLTAIIRSIRRKQRVNINTPGDAHELTFSCYKSIPLLQNDTIRNIFLDSLEAARKKWHFEVWAYVIMPEHVHLLVWPREAIYDIALIRKAIKRPASARAVAILKARAPKLASRLQVTWPSGRKEYRFWQQGGGYDRNLYAPDAIRSSIEYIHNNPVRRALVETPLSWPWSSAACYHDAQGVPFKTDRWRGS